MERLNGSAINPYFAAENRHAGMSSAPIDTGMDYGYSINPYLTAKNRLAEMPSVTANRETSIGNVSPYAPSVAKLTSAPYTDSTYPSLDATYRIGSNILIHSSPRKSAALGDTLTDRFHARQIERIQDDLGNA